MSKTIGEFLRHAAQALTIEYKLHCPVCWKTTNHSIHVCGYWEYYTCDVCGNVQSYKVR